MKKIIVMGGFSNSGKTTSLKILEKIGWQTASTSKLLHTFTQNIVRSLTGEEIDTYDRNATFKGMTTRQLLIHMAREQFEPVFGRSAFVAGVVEQLINGDSPLNQYVVECFHAEEYELLRVALMDANLYHTCVNLRSPAENPKADNRTLLPTANAIYNNGTLEELEAEWLNFTMRI
jgi:hypothetical protein